MKPTFTTPCFIRKNTPDLRRKLEELGYTVLPNGYRGKYIPIDEFPYVSCKHGAVYFNTDMERVLGSKGVDCGTNEDLFLAVAALRSDSDKNQWFCDDIEESKSFFFCEYDDVEKHIHEKMDGWDCEGFHKATVEELIEHFK